MPNDVCICTCHDRTLHDPLSSMTGKKELVTQSCLKEACPNTSTCRCVCFEIQ